MQQRPIIIEFTDWYAVPDGGGCIDWDCDFLVKVFEIDGTVKTLPCNCQRDREQLDAQYPDAVKPDCWLSMHRGKWEGTTALEYLRDNAPDHFDRMMAQAEPRSPLTQNQ